MLIKLMWDCGCIQHVICTTYIHNVEFESEFQLITLSGFLVGLYGIWALGKHTPMFERNGRHFAEIVMVRCILHFALIYWLEHREVISWQNGRNICQRNGNAVLLTKFSSLAARNYLSYQSLRCSEWRKFRQNDIILSMVSVKHLVNNAYECVLFGSHPPTTSAQHSEMEKDEW